MKKKKYKVLRCLLYAAAILSCEEGESTQPRLNSLTVLNDERSALSARISFTLSKEADAYAIYWPADGREEEAITSAVSSPGAAHTIPLYWLQEKTSYNFKIVAGATETGGVQTFTTAAIPAGVTAFFDDTENGISETASGYYLFHNMEKPGYLYLADRTGKMVWYRSSKSRVKAARFTAAKTILTLQDENDNAYGDADIILETTLAGDTLFFLKKGQQGFDQMAHHDVQLNSNGNIVVVTNVYENNLPGDGILVLNRQGKKVWEWNTFGEITDIDPETYAQPWINSLTIDTDGNYIISLRRLCQVWKVNSTTGRVMWKLGKNGNIEMDEEGYFLYQHFAHRNKHGDLMLFDNGSADRPTSRALAFSLDETALKATVKIDTPLPAGLYSVIMGSAFTLPDDNILAASAVNGRMVKLDADGNVLWELKTNDRVYRVEYVAGF